MNYWCFTMATKFPYQWGMRLIPFVSRNLHTKYELNRTSDKWVIDVLVWLPWQPSFHKNEEWGWCLLYQGITLPNMNWIKLKTNELLMFSLVAMATKFHSIEVWGWCLLSQGISILNMNQIDLNTKELLMFHHGNQVSIAMTYEADAYCLKDLHTKYEPRKT